MDTCRTQENPGLDGRQSIAHSKGSVQSTSIYCIGSPSPVPTGLNMEGQMISAQAVDCIVEEEQWAEGNCNNVL